MVLIGKIVLISGTILQKGGGVGKRVPLIKNFSLLKP